MEHSHGDWQGRAWDAQLDPRALAWSLEGLSCEVSCLIWSLGTSTHLWSWSRLAWALFFGVSRTQHSFFANSGHLSDSHLYTPCDSCLRLNTVLITMTSGPQLNYCPSPVLRVALSDLVQRASEERTKPHFHFTPMHHRF